MTNVDDEIRRALGMLDAAAPSPPSWSDIDREPPLHGRRGAVLLAVAAIVAVVVAATMLRLGTRDADTDIVDVPSPTARPDDLDGIDGDDAETDDVETAPGVAPLHPEFARMLADDGQPSTTGSGLDEIPCFQDPPPPSDDVAAEPFDHVRDVEVHVNDTCIRSVFVLGTDAESGGRPLTRAPDIDLGAAVGVIATRDRASPFAFVDQLEFVPGSDLVDFSTGLVGVFGGMIYNPGNPLAIELWADPARLVIETPITGSIDERLPISAFPTPQPVAPPGSALRSGQVVRVSAVDPGVGDSWVTLRRAPDPGSPPGSGDPVPTAWSTAAVFDEAAAFGVACGTVWQPSQDIAADAETSQFRFATREGPHFSRFVLRAPPPGGYELAFENASGTGATHARFTVKTCRHLEIGPDGAWVAEIGADGTSRPVSETIRIGDSGFEALQIAAEAFDAGGRIRQRLNACRQRTQHEFVVDRSGTTQWGPSAIQVEDGLVVAIAGTTVEGIGGGSTRNQVRDALGFDIATIESPTGLFRVGPYRGRVFGGTTVQEVWIGDTAWSDGAECFVDWS